MRRKHIINSLSGVLQMVLSGILVFITIPRFIKILGPEQYGIYSLSFLIGNIGSFTNLGINSALIKFLGEQGPGEQSDYDIISTYAFYAAVAVPFSVIMILASDFFLISVFGIPAHFITPQVKAFYYLLVIANVFTIVGQTPSAILDIAQQVYLNNLFMFLYNLLYWGILFGGLLFVNNLLIAGIASITSTLVWFVLMNYYALKHWKVTWRKITPEVFKHSAKKQIAYGSKLYSGGILNMFFEPLSKILVSNFVGLKEVGFLDIAFRIKFYVWSVPSRLLYPVLPIIAGLQDNDKIKKLIYSVEKMVMLLIIPLTALMVFCAGPFVEFWLKAPNREIEMGIAIITGGYLLGSVLIPNYHYLLMKGHPEKTSYMQVVNVLANTIIFFALHKYFGFYAIVYGNAGALIASSLLGVYYQNKLLKTPVFESFSAFGRILVFAAVLSSALILLRYINFIPVIYLTASAIVVPLLSVLCVRFLKLINEADIDLFFPGVSRPGLLLRKVVL